MKETENTTKTATILWAFSWSISVMEIWKCLKIWPFLSPPNELTPLYIYIYIYIERAISIDRGNVRLRMQMPSLCLCNEMSPSRAISIRAHSTTTGDRSPQCRDISPFKFFEFSPVDFILSLHISVQTRKLLQNVETFAQFPVIFLSRLQDDLGSFQAIVGKFR